MKTKLIIAFLIVFFTPIQASMIGCGVLVIIDCITGVVAAKKRKEKIESNKLKNTIVKLVLYQIGIITAHLIETYIFSSIAFTKIILSSISVIEFYSVVENISFTTGVDLLTVIKSKISEKLKPHS